MKKILLFITAAMISASCSGDDNSTTNSVNPNPTSLLGTWKMTSWKIGDKQQDINSCQEEHNYLNFTSTTNMVESFGELDGVECIHDQYSHKYAVSGDEFSFKEIVTEGVPFQAKFKILNATNTEFTIRQYWVSQETPSGGVEEKNIPINEQETTTYKKQ